MALCPRCTKPLERRQTPHGCRYVCPECLGAEVALSVLRREGASPGLLKRLWAGARSPDARQMLWCPHCNRRTSRVTLEDAGQRLNVDVCVRCVAVWFDRGELDKAVAMSSPAKPLSPEAREKLALLQLKVENELRSLDKGLMGDEGPPESWQWVPAVFGMPVEEEPPERTCRPWLTWAIAAVLALVFLATAGYLQEATSAWGFVPALWYRRGIQTLGASFFLHAGILHLAGNLYFFLLFADNVEDDLGRWWFLLLLAGSHVAGMLLQWAWEPHSMVFLVGASAGVSGIVGYYALTFPGARVGMFLMWLRFLPLYDRMTALEFLGVYVLLQLVGAWRQVPGFGGTAYLAHLGGLAVGIAVAIGVRLSRKRVADLLDALIAVGGGGT